MVAASFSETLASVYQWAWHHIPEDKSPLFCLLKVAYSRHLEGTLKIETTLTRLHGAITQRVLLYETLLPWEPQTLYALTFIMQTAC